VYVVAHIGVVIGLGRRLLVSSLGLRSAFVGYVMTARSLPITICRLMKVVINVQKRSKTRLLQRKQSMGSLETKRAMLWQPTT